MLVVVALAGVNLYLKKFSSSNHFFRTALGQFAFALATGLVGTVTHIVQTQGLHKVALAYGISGFLVSFFATESTEKPGGDILKVLALLALPLGLSGCAFGRCELNRLPQTLQPLLVTAIALAAQPSGYVQDLVQLAENEAPGQVDCIAEAIIASRKPGATAIPTMTFLVAEHMREYLDARKASGVKVSCGERKHMLHGWN